jgi:hypothetical protein
MPQMLAYELPDSILQDIKGDILITAAEAKEDASFLDLFLDNPTIYAQTDNVGRDTVLFHLLVMTYCNDLRRKCEYLRKGRSFRYAIKAPLQDRLPGSF